MEVEVSEGFKDWEQVRSSKDLSMVVIRHSLPHDCSVFPPTNHEGLHISQQTPQSTPPSSSSASPSQHSSSSSPLSSSSSSQLNQMEDDPEPFSEVDEIEDCRESFSPPDSRIRLPIDVSGWLSSEFEVLRSKIFCIVSEFRNHAAVRWPVWPLCSAAGIVMVLLLSLLYRSVQRRRFREEIINQMMILLKERDERIIQLLQQIAKMNLVFLARHRVP